MKCKEKYVDIVWDVINMGVELLEDNNIRERDI